MLFRRPLTAPHNNNNKTDETAAIVSHTQRHECQPLTMPEIAAKEKKMLLTKPFNPLVRVGAEVMSCLQQAKCQWHTQVRSDLLMPYNYAMLGSTSKLSIHVCLTRSSVPVKAAQTPVSRQSRCRYLCQSYCLKLGTLRLPRALVHRYLT